ncbi:MULTISPECIES: helix-turn-helix domain-containing protein [unclassified Ruegeria]|uniref:helix-turn-helix domain-containing protein n=1 Tax=unclassified Ruegeria TaxID=2625375 RepID=UPI001487A7A7|nr:MULTISPECIES: XRE family transcriptional regulator [unclassified Ruegeria]NOD36522.1 helix-turn-helix domain-containing protein [Ruegeria sp. HKCCD7296]NOD48169.1 helix-turn-helix domain-containing protein [Ruegeria sp. HKCCD5849]NOD53882.1 helix-turn-helix domain-containing protein [Ruegeria sp. HKCCD5851]NOD68819.1 helix-turn-helix domain-containing protein [Ruegeria sp. HKCCD7303]NOE36463.1 helix-turn-helix domain-containing protein [Ruegeria sp. HKCCD7318]
MGDDHWNEGSVQDEEDEGAALGRSIRDARREKGWTLEEAGRAAGIGRSTLSKIENNQTKPSFEIVRRLTQALDMNPPQLFLESGQSGIAGRRDFTAKGQGDTRETATYLHELLCSDLTSKRMLPYIATIRARDISEFDPLVHHSGEEFMYVLSGELIFLSEHYRPLPMKAGDSLYYDSGMGHGCISTSKEDAKVLWVSLE